MEEASIEEIALHLLRLLLQIPLRRDIKLISGGLSSFGLYDHGSLQTLALRSSLPTELLFSRRITELPSSTRAKTPSSSMNFHCPNRL